jgi:hypothetical protein
MPRYLIEQDLRDRSLLAITGRYFKGGQADIVSGRYAQNGSEMWAAAA